jgi:outer membrane receptor protein involved in Fe transport
LSLTGSYVGTQWLRGDEANQERPLSDYFVMNGRVRARWQQLTGFVQVNNLLNNTYETFGTFAPNARRPGDPVERFLTPAPPIHVLAGISYQF